MYSCVIVALTNRYLAGSFVPTYVFNITLYRAGYYSSKSVETTDNLFQSALFFQYEFSYVVIFNAI